MAEEEAKTEAPAPAPAAKGDKKNMVPLLFMVVNLVAMGAGAFWVFQSTLGFEPEVMVEEEALAELNEERESEDFESVLYSMDEFTVNLAGQPSRKLRIALHLEMLDAEGFEEVINLQAESRDSILRLLGGMTFGDLESIQGKLFLKDQIATTLNRSMVNGVVKDVYFSQFLVQ